jgi:integrase/recombinase XerD
VAVVDEVLAVGSLAPAIREFEQELEREGYAASSVAAHARQVRALDRWLAREGIGVGEMTGPAVTRFLTVRHVAGSTRTAHVGAGRMVVFLQAQGLLVAEERELGEAERLLEEYGRYLRGERGLGDRSVPVYMRVAERFLAGCSVPLRDDLLCVSGARINEFVLAECEGYSAAHGKLVVRGLRSFLRFLHVDGWLGQSLLEAVPRVARREPALPRRALSPEHLRRLLDSCDRLSVRGARDFAILTVLSRLGLRAREAASLLLDDVDWAGGEMLVRGKAARLERLPLPSDVGQALVEYLRCRPPSQAREVFLRTLAPLVGLSAGSVTSIVSGACARAGVPVVGAHALRHSVACGLVREGAPLPEVAQLLRHRSLLATSIYAKVEPPALRALALTWPGKGGH